MSTSQIFNAFKKTGLTVALAAAAFTGVAHAGAVSTSFDPLFGIALPNLGYAGTFDFTVPDSCLGSMSGVYSLPLPCGGTLTGLATLTLYDKNSLATSITSPQLSLDITGLDVNNGVVVGWSTDRSNDLKTYFAGLAAANGPGAYVNSFDISYLNGVPLLACRNCNGGTSTIRGEHDNFIQKSIVTNDGGVTHIVTMTLDGGSTSSINNVITQVPEPSSLMLSLAGLLGLGFMVRRKR
ncbi:PEP-CTERM sorting domain-containing protein [Paucibacter sp. TC2R-5]|uniref:PEP-CTERM sorting domain-containing protein n=1 Tax=Paucibacter sp. TC2R-5 TaxID=2893555 RepID=UPI0021E3696C|nr:PEP-CTERM sorting domain-containing protein [Paucibacter sp. TC2R-5]MCV2357519.1 PEP-CTERM sorting domain-containing protein [Paucibacter sp. TC2R-5]